MFDKIDFKNKMVMVGFGAMGQGIFPLLWKHIEMQPSQFTIVTDTEAGSDIAKLYGVNFIVKTITADNYRSTLKPLLEAGAMLLNMSVNIGSTDLIKLCQEQQALYLDLSTEPWAGAGGYFDAQIPPAARSNYVLREECLKLKPQSTSTAVITHGANPGMVSHLVKKALINIAKDNDLTIDEPQTATEWARLAQQLNIKAIHVAERDTQVTNRPYRVNEFVNTWSVDGFIEEALQPAELGWGTHERKLPKKGKQHIFGCKSAIYMEQPGASVRIRSWSPSHGSYHGFLITHAEAISISNYLTLQDNNQVIYRPTVHYSYLPSPYAVLSLHELMGKEGIVQEHKHVLIDEITSGSDELGVLLMGNEKNGAYWYGSTLDIKDATELAPYNNATSLQVVASALAAVLWAIENPDRGLVEPDELDYKYIMEKAMPYLGTVKGYYTQWTPLDNRNCLFEEDIDPSDPWQFSNIFVQNE